MCKILHPVPTEFTSRKFWVFIVVLVLTTIETIETTGSRHNIRMALPMKLSPLSFFLANLVCTVVIEFPQPRKMPNLRLIPR